MQTQYALVTGGRDDPFLPKLLDAINRANEIRCVVSFIRGSGLDLIFDALKDAMDRNATIQILTSDYMGITEPEALRKLMLLSERGADIRVFETQPDQGFHIKSYIFTQGESGCAFVGSSNLSKMALEAGFEWNLCVDRSEEPDRFDEILNKYRRLLNHKNINVLTDRFIESYIQRRKPAVMSVEGATTDEFMAAVPNDIQQAALAELQSSRAEGFKRGLVVLATGLGKTWLAAFDAKQVGAGKVLFVAHREEILLQAEETFARINPSASVGYYTGRKKQLNADFLFASVQTLGADRHLGLFDAEYFDYIVIDEFHHATSSSYRRLIDYFKPKFMLGLTATPERTDHADILSLCDNNLVFEKNFVEGIEANLLSPFVYYGIFDKHVDYAEIPWRNGRFDPDDLSNKLATTARAKHVFREWLSKKKIQKRTLAFCVSRKHADFMARYFIANGIRAAAVYAGSQVPRNHALQQLEAGRLEVLFSVDLFNEGMDLPAIDIVMMLRPTESKILYLQQLGRGLRLHMGKSFLLVLDFIGNHKSFFKRPEALFGVRSHSDIPTMYKSQSYQLPPECYVQFDLETIGFIEQYIKSTKPEFERIYDALKDAGEQRPTAAEVFRAGIKFEQIRKKYGSWFDFVSSKSDLLADEVDVLHQYREFFQEVEKLAMTKSFKMIMLEAFLQLDGFVSPPTLELLSIKSADLLCRRPTLFSLDVPTKLSELCQSEDKLPASWFTYWESNPINAFVGGNKSNVGADFRVEDSRLVSNLIVSAEVKNTFHLMLRELIDYRLTMYMVRKGLAPSLRSDYHAYNGDEEYKAAEQAPPEYSEDQSPDPHPT